jgi:putative oxidoreductase
MFSHKWFLFGWAASYRIGVNGLLRVATSLIFIIGGLGHFVQDHVMLKRIEESPWHDWVVSMGDPSFFLYLSGGVMLVAGLGLALGLFTRLSSLLLFVTLVPITFVIHIAPDHVGPLFKNIAILGTLMFFFVSGGGWLSVDRKLGWND